MLKNVLRNVNQQACIELAKDKLFSNKITQKLLKDKSLFDKKVSGKKFNKKREDSKTEFPKNQFMTIDTSKKKQPEHNKSGSVIGHRSNSIDANKKLRERRKKSSEYSVSFVNTASGKNMSMARNGSELTHLKSQQMFGDRLRSSKPAIK